MGRHALLLRLLLLLLHLLHVSNELRRWGGDAHEGGLRKRAKKHGPPNIRLCTTKAATAMSERLNESSKQQQPLWPTTRPASPLQLTTKPGGKNAGGP